jgi:GT2 family glycosyltransferase
MQEQCHGASRFHTPHVKFIPRLAFSLLPLADLQSMEATDATPTVSVILATLRRPEPLALVLGDLARQEGLSAEVVVIDQNSPPSPDALFAVFEGSRHRLVRLTHPGGVVAARHKGVEQSTGEVLVFIDDDTRIRDPRFLWKYAQNFVDPTLAGVCGQELSPPAFKQSNLPAPAFQTAFEAAMFFPRASCERREVHHLATCNCAVRRSAWNRVGGLDMVFAGNSYGDDYDLALRMRQAGLRIVFDPEISVEHTRAPMGGLRLDDPSNRYTEAEKYVSLWVFYLRHVPPAYRLWYIRTAVLRKSLLLKKNAFRPWRWPAILLGLLSAYIMATRTAQRSASQPCST